MNTKIVKAISFVRYIEDMGTFENYIADEVLPLLLLQKGLIYINTTRLFPISPELPSEIKGIKFIFESVFQSEKYLRDLLYTDLGKKIMNKALNIPSGELTIFVGKEKVFSPYDKVLKENKTAVKTVSLIQHITNMDSFENYFSSTMLPLTFKQKGLLNVNVTSLYPMSPDLSSDLNSINLMIDNIFESGGNIQDILNTRLYKNMLNEVFDLPSGQIHLLIGNEKRFYPTP